MARFNIKNRLKAVGDAIEDAVDDVRDFAGRYYNKAKDKLHNLTGRTREEKELEAIIEIGKSVAEGADNVEDFQKDVVEGLNDLETAVNVAGTATGTSIDGLTAAVGKTNKLLLVQVVLSGIIAVAAVVAVVLLA